MDNHVKARVRSSGYYTAPCRKARLCARFVLRPELLDRPAYARLAKALLSDPSVTNRLVGQAVAHLKGKAHQHRLAG
jgi:hypothetical protein